MCTSTPIDQLYQLTNFRHISSHWKISSIFTGHFLWAEAAVKLTRSQNTTNTNQQSRGVIYTRDLWEDRRLRTPALIRTDRIEKCFWEWWVITPINLKLLCIYMCVWYVSELVLCCMSCAMKLNTYDYCVESMSHIIVIGMSPGTTIIMGSL